MNRRLAAMLVLAACSIAPTAFASNLSLTFRGGIGISKLTTESSAFEFENRTAFVGGIGLAIPLNESWSIEPELGYAMRGASFGESEGTDQNGNVLGTLESVLEQDMLTITVPVRYTVPLSEEVRFGLLAGPAVAFEMRERSVTTGAVDRTDASDILDGTDFDAVFGGGLDFRLGPGRLGVEARFVVGLVGLFPDSSTGGQTRSVEVTAGYSFPLGH
jgi:hypothetical protein